MAQARPAQLINPFRALRSAVAADDIVRALARVGFTQKQIASATGATDRSVRNWAATGAIRDGDAACAPCHRPQEALGPPGVP
jgi:hypothetical protein